MEMPLVLRYRVLMVSTLVGSYTMLMKCFCQLSRKVYECCSKTSANPEIKYPDPFLSIELSNIGLIAASRRGS